MKYIESDISNGMVGSNCLPRALAGYLDMDYADTVKKIESYTFKGASILYDYELIHKDSKGSPIHVEKRFSENPNGFIWTTENGKNPGVSYLELMNKMGLTFHECVGEFPNVEKCILCYEFLGIDLSFRMHVIFMKNGAIYDRSAGGIEHKNCITGYFI